MPDLSGYDLALLGLVAILVIHSMQEPPEGPDPAEEPAGQAPPPPPPPTRPALDPTDWNQMLVDQALAAGLAPAAGDSARDTSTRIAQATADIGETGGDLDQTDVLEDLSSGGRGFVSGRGL